MSLVPFQLPEQRKVTDAFLHALFAKAHPDAWIEIRGIVPKWKIPSTPEKQRSLRRFFHLRELPLIHQCVSQFLSQERNVYFGVCPRAVRRGDKTAIKQVLALWADLDLKRFGGTLQEQEQAAQEALSAGDLCPDWLVHSGHGYHAYFLLSEPFRVQSEADWLSIENKVRWLAQRLQGDPTVATIERVLRFPGTINFRDQGHPVPVRIVTPPAAGKGALAL